MATATKTRGKERTVRHLDGCPEGSRRGEAGSLETFRQTGPRGRVVEITRCVDCGAHEAELVGVVAVPVLEDEGDEA